MKKLHLDCFEDEINGRILERGYEYYLDGRVTNEGTVGDDLFFSVEGNELYEVHLCIKGNEVVEYECDCPYDMGPVCKHIVACLYSLLGRDQKMEDSSEEQVTNPYERSILAAIDYAGRRGFIDWNSARELGESAEELLEEAESAYCEGDYRLCIDICCPVLVHMCDALGYADDSNGDIGDPIRMAFDQLIQVAMADDLDEATRQNLTGFCYESFKNNAFKGWDWHLGMMELAVELARNKDDAALVIDTLTTSYSNSNGPDRSYHEEYEYERAMSIILSAMQSFYPLEETDAFCHAHLNIRAFRDAAIERSIEDNQLDDAKRLAASGIEQDTKDKPGLVAHWMDYLLRIAIRENDRDSIIKYAELLWLDGHISNWIDYGDESIDFYGLLKKTIDPEEWSSYIESFSEKLLASRCWQGMTYPDLCIKEKWWSKLFKYVQESKSALTLKKYEKYLKKDYKDELISIYTSYIYDELKRGVGRGRYQQVCSYLRHINKLGGRSQSETIIKDLREKYPRRPALLEELDNV